MSQLKQIENLSNKIDALESYEAVLGNKIQRLETDNKILTNQKDALAVIVQEHRFRHEGYKEAVVEIIGQIQIAERAGNRTRGGQ
jgi:hypothetical protein